MFLLIKFTLLYAVVLMLVALGGMFSERSGVINIALEGIMAIGGLAGVFVLALCGDSLPSGVLVAVSILASAVAGILYSLLLGFSAITLKADQTIGGTALNMLATAVAIVAVKAFNNLGSGNGAASAKLSYSNKAFIYKIGPLTINIFLIIGIIILIVSYVFCSRPNGAYVCARAVNIRRQPIRSVSMCISGDIPVS